MNRITKAVVAAAIGVSALGAGQAYACNSNMVVKNERNVPIKVGSFHTKRPNQSKWAPNISGVAPREIQPGQSATFKVTTTRKKRTAFQIRLNAFNFINNRGGERAYFYSNVAKCSQGHRVVVR